MDRDQTIVAIRTALKKRSGKQWSVKGGRGTASGWITISAPPKRLGCQVPHDDDYATRICNACHARLVDDDAPIGCSAHECTDRCYLAYMTPADRAELGELLGKTIHMQGESIPASSDYYNEYAARAAGLEPVVIGSPYWD